MAVIKWEVFCLLGVILALMTLDKKAAHSAEMQLCFTNEASRLLVSQVTITSRLIVSHKSPVQADCWSAKSPSQADC